MTMIQQHPFQTVVKEALQKLDKSLIDFEQTTHGLLFLREPSIEYVCEQLIETYNNPSAYNISSLNQILDAFLNDKFK